jgi:hypothetical protein
VRGTAPAQISGAKIAVCHGSAAAYSLHPARSLCRT